MGAAAAALAKRVIIAASCTMDINRRCVHLIQPKQNKAGSGDGGHTTFRRESHASRAIIPRDYSTHPSAYQYFPRVVNSE